MQTTELKPEDSVHRHDDEKISTPPEENLTSDEPDHAASFNSSNTPEMPMPVVEADEHNQILEDAAQEHAHAHAHAHAHDTVEGDDIGAEPNDPAIAQQDGMVHMEPATRSDTIAVAGQDEDDDASLAVPVESTADPHVASIENTQVDAPTQFTLEPQAILEEFAPMHSCGDDAGASEPHPELLELKIADAPEQQTLGM